MKRPQSFLRARLRGVTKQYGARGIERENLGQCDKACTALESLQFITIPKNAPSISKNFYKTNSLGNLPKLAETD